MSKFKNKFVIVRCKDAGVHAGYLKKVKGRTVTLRDSKRLWYWKAVKGHTLSAVSLHGITDESKLSGSVKNIILLDACEILPCKKVSIESIINSVEYNE